MARSGGVCNGLCADERRASDGRLLAVSGSVLGSLPGPLAGVDGVFFLPDVRHQVGRLNEVVRTLVAPRQHEFEVVGGGLDQIDHRLRGDELAVGGIQDLSTPFALDSDPDDGMHMLVLDELLYAADRDLVDPEAVVDLVESAPDGLELVLSGSHERPDYLVEAADLVTNVRKEKHPIDAGQRARKGTEY